MDLWDFLTIWNALYLFLAYYLYRWVSGTYCVFSFSQLEDAYRAVRARHPKEIVDLEAFFEDVRHEISLRYPGHVAPKLEWVWCHCGGVLWSYAVVHVSLTEYVLITGTGTGSDGLTGRHIAQISDILLHGWARYADEDKPYAPMVIKEGHIFHLPPFATQSLNIPEELWLLEYGRGFIPLLLPYGVIGNVFSTLDFLSIIRTFWVYGKFMCMYCFRWPFLRTSHTPVVEQDATV
jgi:hypothetical protein